MPLDRQSGRYDRPGSSSGETPARRLRADASRTVRPNGLSGAARSQRMAPSGRLATPVPPTARQGQSRSAVDTLRLILNVIIALLVVGIVVSGALLALRATGAFEIQTLEAPATEHLSGDDIARLANVGQGTTLLDVDVEAVKESVSSEPWVKDVEVDRVFPDTLRIVVTERAVSEIVLMASGQIAWYVGDGDMWIEPVALTPTGGQTTGEAALALALDMGSLLVTDVPATVAPVAGSVVTDEPLLAVGEYLDELPSELTAQIASFSAPSADAISCVLSSGVEVLLGSPTDIASKGAIVLRLLSEHEGEITYINVRSVSDPSYRKISSDSVQPGTGTVASSESSSTEETAE